MWQRTHNSGFHSHLEHVLLGVRDSAPGSKEADKLYRIPAVTESDLLSPGSQALVPCCRGEPRTVKELHYASRGVGRIALRDCPVPLA
ncbi:hypothetical protein PIB30_040872 [Stylosanthes scabra]|uniref:Uncharacterized protein n=1 Tax=Stylosanthes scabra TaxID=79078 RepID=A0ABU6SEX8_9FABA|nr:hypothetical protein [Stylosanthes scabra]